MKEAGQLPCGQVPLLEVDGKILTQSQAIAPYCAKLAGIYPTDPFEAAKCDEVTQLINQDIRERTISPAMKEPDAEKKAAMRKELGEEKLPAKFKILESFLQPSGYFCGDSITIADLHAVGPSRSPLPQPLLCTQHVLLDVRPLDPGPWAFFSDGRHYRG